MTLMLRVLVICAAALGVVNVSQAATFTNVHSFVSAEGANPYDGVIQLADGTLVGTCFKQGTIDTGGGGGSVFKVQPGGTGFTVLHLFNGALSSGSANVGGSRPTTAPLLYSDGFLYGITPYGGSVGYGVMYKVKPDATGYATIKDFDNAAGSPQYTNAGLVLGADGYFYGGGGASSGGQKLFKINQTASSLQAVHTFTANSTEGTLVTHPLLSGLDGKIYGITAPYGGAGHYSTVFRVNNDGTGFQVLHTFTTGEGDYPYCGVTQASDGTLYGQTVTTAGVSSVFKMNPDGTGFAILHTLTAAEGTWVSYRLLLAADGKLYGAAGGGGANSKGTVFSLNTNGSGFTVLYNFTGSATDHSAPNGSLIQGLDGLIYGTTTDLDPVTFAAVGFGGVFAIGTPSPGPTVTAINPTSGTTAGGTPVTITGTNFTGATGVTIGGTAATSVNVSNATTITCTTPVHVAGTASVLVTTPSGTNTANTLYTYVAPAPTVTAINPTSGTTAGGTGVTITGTNLTGATGVTIGGTAATGITVVDAATITCTTPAGSAGTASVLVTTSGGTNAANTLYTYVTPPPAVTVAVTPSSRNEDAGAAFTYTFTRSGATTAALTVNFTSVGSGAAPGIDFSVASGSGTATYNTGTGLGTFVIPAGAASANLTVTPVADNDVEADETVVFNVATGSGYDIGVPGTATGTITNDDIGIAFDALPVSSLSEDQPLNFTYTFHRYGLTTGTTVVNFLVGGSATFGTDYTQSGATSFTTTNGTVTFAPGETTKVVTLDPTADNLVGEGDETIILNIVSGTGYNGVSTTIQTATITNDDSIVSVIAPSPPATTVEDSGLSLLYTFTRTAPSSSALVVNVQVSGTAALTGDYTTSGFTSFNTGTGQATVTIAAGATSKDVTITPTADVTGESNETIILTVAANGTPAVTGGYTVSPAPFDSATGTIIDDDALVSVAIAPSASGESSGTPMVYTFTRTGSTAAALTANFTVTGTASFAASDYSINASLPNTVNGAAGTGTVIFGIGSSTTSISATPLGDAIVEANETVIVTVATGSGYTPAANPNNVATGTINDDDTATVSIAKITDGLEGPPIINGKFRLTQTAVSSTNTVVNYSIAGTATPGAGNDYATLSGTATLLAGNTTVDIDVIVQADAISEPAETVIVTLTTLGAGTNTGITVGAPSTATVTILSPATPLFTSGVGAPPGAPGTTYESIRSGAVIASSGALAFRGHLTIGTGGVDANNYEGVWKSSDGTVPALALVARSGSAAPDSGSALFDILPVNPVINAAAQTSFLGYLRVNTGSPLVTTSTDTGVWSELGGLGLHLVLREGNAITGGTTGAIAPSTTVVTGDAHTAFTVMLVPTGSALVRAGVVGATVTVATIAKEGDAAPAIGGGTSGTFDTFAGNSADPRMDAAGDLAFLGYLQTSGTAGIWYQAAAGSLVAVAKGGQTSFGIADTFTAFERPSLGSATSVAFRAFLTTNGQSVFRGNPATPSTILPVAVSGDTNVQIPTIPAGRKLWSIWSPFSASSGRIAFRASMVDTAGNTNENRAILADTSGTMTVIAKVGDVAPGTAGDTFVNFDHPAIGDGNQAAFTASTQGGIVGLWKQAAGGGALNLVVKVGDTYTINAVTETVASIIIPGASSADRTYETRCMDAAGHLLVHVTYASGKTGIILSGP